jgi:hypothetical protein
MSYHCPACNKVSVTSYDLARHMMGRGDKVHRDWINGNTTLKFSELRIMELKSFGGEGYKALSQALEKVTKKNY